MKTIRLWSAEKNGNEKHNVTQLDELRNTDTELLLEELLVEQPDLLMEGLKLIGRQVSTGGGPLDLLGIDESGRLVVFELKRGTLTRDAVAQVLDYASFLSELDSEGLCRLIEEHSGQGGIEKIEDFAEWYSQIHAGELSAIVESPRMVLVGLGIDDRARRVVKFLNSAGCSMELLSFHAFQLSEKIFFARHAEHLPTEMKKTFTGNSEQNLKHLMERAAASKVEDLLERTVKVVTECIPKAYQYPNRTMYTFSLPRIIIPSYSSYVAYLNVEPVRTPAGFVKLLIQTRAYDLSENEISSFRTKHPRLIGLPDKYRNVGIMFGASDWEVISSDLKAILEAISRNWQAKVSAEAETEKNEGE